VLNQFYVCIVTKLRGEGRVETICETIIINEVHCEPHYYAGNVPNWWRFNIRPPDGAWLLVDGGCLLPCLLIDRCVDNKKWRNARKYLEFPAFSISTIKFNLFTFHFAFLSFRLYYIGKDSFLVSLVWFWFFLVFYLKILVFVCVLYLCLIVAKELFYSLLLFT